MKVSLLGVGLLALTSTIGFAQAPAAAPAAPMQRHAATINQRREHQQQRIGQGIRAGRLNARQGARLERRERDRLRPVAGAGRGASYHAARRGALRRWSR